MRYFPRVRSKNHSLDSLRRSNRGLPALPVKSVVRFGSTTPTSQVFRKPTNIPIVEINTVEAIKVSSSKLATKAAFSRAGVNQPEWFLISGDKVLNTENQEVNKAELPYPLVYKKIYGARGKGMRLIMNQEDLNSKLNEINGGYFEKYYSYVREYRLHCTKDGCFYTCRKMLKEDAEERWFRNDSNCVWYLEDNPSFDKPINWASIEEQCIRALKEVGLDFGAFDVRVQGAVNSDGVKRKDPKFVLIEVNSAPSFGEVTERKYKEILPKLIMSKANARN